jgi:hypothetical protein
MKKHLIAASFSLALSLVIAACGGSPSAPSARSESTPTTSTFDYTRGCVQQIGQTSKGEGYLYFYGNLTACETSISDFNGVQFNVFVTNTGTNAVTKYIDEYPNSTVTVPTGMLKGQVIRLLEFGKSVRFEVRLIVNPRVALTYVQMKYGFLNDPKSFMLLPARTYTIGSDYFTTGKLPPADNAATASAASAEGPAQNMDAIVESTRMPKMCVVPPGATDCVAK